MYNILKSAHSGLRWVVIVAMIFAIWYAYQGLKSKSSFTGMYKTSATLFIATLHLQVIIGLVLYFLSPYFEILQQDPGTAMSNKITRFYAVEHLVGMLLAAILVTVGSAMSKRRPNIEQQYKTRLIWFVVGAIIILASIPWPFRIPVAAWF